MARHKRPLFGQPQLKAAIEQAAKESRERRPFESIECVCGHLYGRHPWTADNPRGHGRCLDCDCRHRQDRKVQEEADARRAIAADPSHVCGPFNDAYGCPGWVHFLVCSVCDKPKAAE